MPLVSVIMPVYNEREYMIQEAVNSVINQTFADWELIIICDNVSEDNFKVLLQNFEDKRIRVIFNEQNIGAALSRNEGIKCAVGEYIAFLDADDICEPDRIETEMNYLETKVYDMVCSGSYLIDEEGNIIKKSEQEITEKQLVDYLPYINYICNSSVLVRKSVLNTIGGYHDYPCCHDYDLWMRIRKAGYKIGYINRELVRYRIRKNSITGSKSYLQTINCEFLRRKYRQNKILDNYNKQEYEKYVGKFLSNRSRAINNYNVCVQKRKNFTIKLEQGKYFSAICEYVGVISRSRIYRLNIYNSIRYKIFSLKNRQL